MFRTRFALGAFVAALALPQAVSAQFGWLGDDGFAAVPCCTPAQSILPPFPGFQVGGNYCCITDCDLEQDFDIRVLTSHFQITCDLALVSFTSLPAAPTGPGYTGTLVAKYSRTWVEIDATGAERQVWRFLVNGDLTVISGVAPCPIPPGGTIQHLTGHIDYACESDPTTGVGSINRIALNLNKWPSCITHNPFDASPLTPAGAHDNRSYHLFAPRFFCAPTTALEGTSNSEAIRSTWFPPGQPYTCLGESRVDNYVRQTVFTDCLCPGVPPGPFSYYHQDFGGAYECAGVTYPFTGFAGLPPPFPPVPTGLVTFPLGSWGGTPGQFPGDRQLEIHWGILLMADACNPGDIPASFVTGVSTRDLFSPALNFSTGAAVPYEVVTDLQNMVQSSGLFGPLTIGWGRLFIPKIVWNLNI